MLLINATIYTMNSDVIKSGFIFIKDKIIKAIGNMYELNIQADEVIDLKGMSVYPGFIDAHTHLGLFEDGLDFEGSDGNEECEPITPALRTIDAINPLDNCFKEAFRSGVTTVLSSPGSSNPIAGQISAIKTYGKRIDNMIISDPIGIKFALGENPKTNYHSKDKSPYTRMATASLIRENLIKAKKYLKEKNDYINNPEDFDMPEYDFNLESLIPLLEKKITAYFHAHRTDDIFTAIRISKEFDLDYVIIHATESHMITEELKKEDSKILIGPFLSDRSKPELSNLTPKTAGIVEKAKIDFALITDHPVIPIQYLSLCAALAVREGLDYEEALKSITINPAKICGIDHRVGSIEIGKDADLVVFKDDPLDIKSQPIMVLGCGKILFSDV